MKKGRKKKAISIVIKKYEDESYVHLNSER